EKTNDVIWTSDLNLRTTYVSPSVERVLGFTPEERLSQDATQQMTPESFDQAADALTHHLALEQDPTADPNRILRIELEYYRKDGSTVWLENQVSGLRDASGTLVGFHGVGRDISERRKAEQALRESRERYRALFDRSLDCIYVHDFEGNFLDANDAALKLLGYDRDDVPQLSFATLLSEDQLPAALAVLQELMETGTQKRMTEYTLRRKDGELVQVETVASVIQREGKPYAIQGIARDISKRRKAEQELRLSEEKYRLLTEKTNDVIWTTGLDLLTNYISPSVERILGFTPEHTLGQDVAEQMTPESVARAKEALARHLALEQDPNSDPNRNLRIELEYYHKDGSTVWLENQVSGIRDASGKLVGFHGVARDITERRKAEQALKESEKKYRVLAENTNDLIWMADLNMRPTYMSPSTERIMGFTPEESLKRDLADNTTPESLTKAQEALLHHLALEEDPSADPNRTLILELEFYRKDGSTVWLEQHVNGIRDADGTLVGFHGVARDVTERKRAEQALRERLKELQCIAGVTRLAEKPELPIEDFVREVVGLLPAAWQYPDICVARIQLDSKEFKTANYHETDWSQSADIRVDEKRFGTVTVCYLQEMPEADEGPFLKEERTMIDTIADFLGHVIQHRQMEQHLRASEERYRLLAQNASDIIWVIDANLKITYISPSATSLLGYSVEELMTGSFESALTPESLARVAQVYMDDMVTEKSTPGSTGQRLVEIEAVCKDGATVWLEAVTNPIRDADGRLSGFQGACRDITKRRRTQEALAASETNYRNLFEHTLLGMEVVDLQTGKTVLANRSLARMFGFKSVADMIGTKPLDYVLPEDLERVANEMAQLMTDPSWDKKAVIRSKTDDGRLIWVTGMGAPFEYEGKPGMLISLVDITAAKEAEFKLTESEEKNRLLIDNAAEGIIVVQDGVTKFFNRRCVEVTGRSSEELLAGSFLDIVHPEDREMVALNYMKRVAGEDVPNNYQFRTIDKAGNTRWLQVNAVRLTWEGRPATLTMLSDVTDRVKAEQALRDSEERFRSLVEKATDAVAVLDAAGNVRYYTPSMERVTGYGPGEWLDKSLSDLLLHPDDLPKLAAVLEQLLKEPGASIENFTTRYQHRDGSWHVLEATARNMLHDPKINGIVANFRDITERVKAEEKLKESEGRYRLLAENATDVIWVADLNLRLTYASPAVTRLLGYTMEEV
ncbi:MAG TPA: PAS domain S-box protein, partial [Dehalococcoidia bacterium]|nr:PAS domain S-box protein [Dehalococcoidia bacterium]